MIVLKVNGYTYGIFNDVLEALQSQLNFTSNLYKRKKTAWGYIFPQPNGTLRGTGNIIFQFMHKKDPHSFFFHFLFDIEQGIHEPCSMSYN